MQKKLIVMLKYPQPGAVKTRLIPALGADRACTLYRSLVRQTLAVVDDFAREENVAIELRVAGAPDDFTARQWLGEKRVIHPQGEGDLGKRMLRALEDAFFEGTEATVIIGADCPELAKRHLVSAFAALQENELTLGPAADGGYYLIGLRRPLPALFHGICWGGADVLAQTLVAAGKAGVGYQLLDLLHDLDRAEDLPSWANTGAALGAGRGGVSVIIPTLDEDERLSATLAAVQHGKPHEVIVVDGGSVDRTVEIARAHDAIVLAASPGRAGQMNCGAAAATGEFLLFLHADTILPADYLALVCTTLARAGVAGGAFEFSISGEFAGRQLIERGTNWRARFWQTPYGDQGIFVRRETFVRVGGFPDLPIMEDYEFVRRLRRLGRIALAPAVALTSSRRWQRLGALRTTLLNHLIVLGYRIGVSPARLAKWYYCPRGLRPGAITGNKIPAISVSSHR